MTFAPVCAWTRPATLAVSDTWPPSAIVPDAAALIVGEAFETTTLSFASLHAPLTGTLFASPL